MHTSRVEVKQMPTDTPDVVLWHVRHPARSTLVRYTQGVVPLFEQLKSVTGRATPMNMTSKAWTNCKTRKTVKDYCVPQRIVLTQGGKQARKSGASCCAGPAKGPLPLVRQQRTIYNEVEAACCVIYHVGATSIWPATK